MRQPCAIPLVMMNSLVNVLFMIIAALGLEYSAKIIFKSSGSNPTCFDRCYMYEIAPCQRLSPYPV